MEIINKKYDKKIENPEAKYLNENSCLLDIETTGFSREYNHIYMIGLARAVNGFLDITLLFAENVDEEKTILDEFITYSKNIESFITFNGLSFDFPFIKARMNHYGIEYDFNCYNQLDIFKECKCLKKPLKLNNLKQKTIESFLGLNREDQFNGGELIEHYKKYCECKDITCYKNLITHNLEDVKGMADILTILRYTNISKILNNSSIEELSFEKDNTIKLILKTDVRLPERFCLSDSYYYIVFDDNTVKIILKPIYDELRYYLNDYKNYVYITNEDIIIPKQLLNAQNKKYANNVTKENCYISNKSHFLPVYNKKYFTDEKQFKHTFNDRICYIDISTHLKDSEYIKDYVINLVKESI